MQEGSLRILIDGKCSLCSREAEFLRRLDRGRGRLVIEDIAAPGFDPGTYGLTMDQVMGSIHGIEADGSVMRAMDVLRGAYRAIGMGWVLSWTAWWPFRRPVDWCYAWFARNRWRFTPGAERCENDRCAVSSMPWAHRAPPEEPARER